MNKVEIANAVAEKSNINKKDALDIVEKVFETIGDALANNDSVNIVGFGGFSTRETKDREGRNPQTGAAITIAASRKPTFKASGKLKDRLK